MSDGLTKLGEAARRARAAISPWNFFSPTDVAGFAPGGGIPSAVEPYKQGLQKTAEATKAFREGRYGDAARWYGSGVLDTGTAALSALPEGGALTKLAMAVAPAVKAAVGSADEVADAGKGAMSKLQGIKAFHGSPHDFDRFSMDKIGTGEGAQAYGHGLYFAENEGVAKGYRDNLSGTQQSVYQAGAPVDGNSWAASAARNLDAEAKLYGFDTAKKNQLDDLNFRLERELKLGANGKPDDVRQAIDLVKNATPDALKVVPESTGKMYEVNIAADPEHFLDWDKPLSEQSQFVQDALRKGPGEPSWRGEKEYFERFPADLDRFGGYRGSEAYTRVAGDQHGQDMAAGAFKQAGIPGIKYLDAGSRSAGDGSRNYVVFDDKLVEIVKKYGWVPGMAIPAAMALELQQAQEQSAPQM